MSKISRTAQIKELLKKLEKETDTEKKRSIRVSLRNLGHKGGLGKGVGRPKKAKKVKKAKKAKKKNTDAS